MPAHPAAAASVSPEVAERLADVDDRPVAEHADIFATLHAELAQRLEAAEG